MQEIQANPTEIDEVLDKCSDAAEEGSRYPVMTFEDGVKYTIEWLVDGQPDPFSDED